MTDWKFGDVLKLNELWDDSFPASRAPNVRVMFLAGEKVEGSAMFTGIYVAVDGPSEHIGEIHGIFSRMYWEPDD